MNKETTTITISVSWWFSRIYVPGVIFIAKLMAGFGYPERAEEYAEEMLESGWVDALSYKQD